MMKYSSTMPPAAIAKNDSTANLLIWVVSLVVFVAVAVLSKVHFNAHLGFNVHLFARANAVINSIVAVLLVAGLISAKNGNYLVHKKIMLVAMGLSVLFLLSYICHHLLAGETRFGDLNHDGLLSEDEKIAAGSLRTVYYVLLGTHIPLAGIILPFILFTSYRALTGEYERHRKLAKIYLADLAVCGGYGPAGVLDDCTVLFLSTNYFNFEIDVA